MNHDSDRRILHQRRQPLFALPKRRLDLFAYGDILRENGAMLAVCRKLGFRIEPGAESNIVRAVMTL